MFMAALRNYGKKKKGVAPLRELPYKQMTICVLGATTPLLGRNWEIEQHALEAGRGDCLLGVRCAFRDDYDDVA